MAAFVGLGAILTTLTLVWMISVRLRDASVADICWGLCFVLLAWVYCFLSPTLTPRSWLVAALITLWGTRLVRAHLPSSPRPGCLVFSRKG
jgi:steroid 5-alpha reductase family enzyme